MRSAKSRHAAVTKDKRQDKIDFLLRGLDQLAAQAVDADMAMAARIFYTAKEELVPWAVTMHFHESAEDRFINRKLYALRGK